MTDPRPFPARREVAEDTLADLLDTPPQMLMDLRFAELEARRVAEDQVLVELLANARDAAVSHQGSTPPRVRLARDGDALLVANDGAPWSRAGYEAVRRIGGSPKQRLPSPGGPGQPVVALSLGRHGIGFRSVLAVSDRPEIHGRAPDGSRFALGFGAPRLTTLAEAVCAGEEARCVGALAGVEGEVLAELLRRRPLAQRSLHRHARRWGLAAGALAGAMPVLAFPLGIPDEGVSARVRALLAAAPASGDDGGEAGYATVIRLPLLAPVERTLEGLAAQLPAAQRCFMGTTIRCRAVW